MPSTSARAAPNPLPAPVARSKPTCSLPHSLTWSPYPRPHPSTSRRRLWLMRWLRAKLHLHASQERSSEGAPRRQHRLDRRRRHVAPRLRPSVRRQLHLHQIRHRLSPRPPFRRYLPPTRRPRCSRATRLRRSAMPSQPRRCWATLSRCRGLPGATTSLTLQSTRVAWLLALTDASHPPSSSNSP